MPGNRPSRKLVDAGIIGEGLQVVNGNRRERMRFDSNSLGWLRSRGWLAGSEKTRPKDNDCEERASEDALLSSRD